MEGDGSLPISLFERSTEVASGQHIPEPGAQGSPQFHPEEFVFSYIEMADEEDKEEEDIKKSALGLTDIPSANVPYANRTGYEEDDYEAANRFFSGKEDGVSSPPVNKDIKDEDHSGEDMEGILDKLLELLESRGHSDKAASLKKMARNPSMLEKEYHLRLKNFYADISKSFDEDISQKVFEITRRFKPTGKGKYNNMAYYQELFNLLSPITYREDKSSWNRRIKDLTMAAKVVHEERLELLSKTNTAPIESVPEAIPSTPQKQSPGRTTSDKVRAIQEALVASGHSIIVDGIWGKNTEKAWNDFWLARGKSSVVPSSIDEAVSLIESAPDIKDDEIKSERPLAIPVDEKGRQSPAGAPEKESITDEDLPNGFKDIVGYSLKLLSNRKGSVLRDKRGRKTPFVREHARIRRWISGLGGVDKAVEKLFSDEKAVSHMLKAYNDGNRDSTEIAPYVFDVALAELNKERKDSKRKGLFRKRNKALDSLFS